MDVVTIVLLVVLALFTLWGIGKDVNGYFGLNLLGIGLWCLGYNFTMWLGKKDNFSDAYNYIVEVGGSGFASFVVVISALFALGGG
jgi:hypothetical protein